MKLEEAIEIVSNLKNKLPLSFSQEVAIARVIRKTEESLEPEEIKPEDMVEGEIYCFEGVYTYVFIFHTIDDYLVCTHQAIDITNDGPIHQELNLAHVRDGKWLESTPEQKAKLEQAIKEYEEKDVNDIDDVNIEEPKKEFKYGDIGFAWGQDTEQLYKDLMFVAKYPFGFLVISSKYKNTLKDFNSGVNIMRFQNFSLQDPRKKETFYSIGDRFKNQSGDTYVLNSAGSLKIILNSLRRGTFIRESIEVNNPRKITQQELNQIGGDGLTKIG